jgi:hypothetical protein
VVVSDLFIINYELSVLKNGHKDTGYLFDMQQVAWKYTWVTGM